MPTPRVDGPDDVISVRCEIESLCVYVNKFNDPTSRLPSSV